MENQNDIASDTGAVGSWTGPNGTEPQSSVVRGEPSGAPPRVGRPTTRNRQNTAQTVSQAQNPLRPGTTRAGITRVRMKWTDDVNTFIMRTYYTITRIETDTTAYRQALHRAFLTEYPNTNITEQRIADQRRVIVRNGMLAPNILQGLKDEVARTLQSNTPHTTQNSTPPQHQTTTTLNTTFPRHGTSPPNTTPPHHTTTPHHTSTSPHHTSPSPNHTTSPHSTTASQHTTPFSPDNTATQASNATLHQADTTAHIETHNTQHTNTLHIPNSSGSSLRSRVRQAFEDALTEFTHIHPTQRHIIPKQGTSKHLSSILDILNTEVLPAHLTQGSTFTEIHNAIYCAAVAAVRCNGSKTRNPTSNTNTMLRKAAWEKRLERRIDAFRRDLGRLFQYKRGNRTKRVVKKIQHILEKQKLHTNRDTINISITMHTDTLIQKLSALTTRLKRYRQSTQRKTQNAQFKHSEKQFYRSLGKQHLNNSPANELPSEANMVDFWSSIWSQEVQHNPNAGWIDAEKQRVHDIPNMPEPQISMSFLTDIIQNTHNWKAPGTDNIQNYWYKKFTSTHAHLLHHINNFINNPETLPTFLTEGITYMIQKDTNNSTDPSKYRPITCLQTFYKIVTSCASKLITQHTHQHNIMAEQQKGCRQGSLGCKEQLLIDSVILRQTKTAHRNMHAAYIDYKKAFDSVPHSWLIEVLHVYKIHPTLTHFLQHTMKHWNTKINIKTQNTQITTPPIQIRRGIFQGDSLSPLWFCLALNPLSHALDATGFGFNIRHNRTNVHRITHLMYMDDIKLYASSASHLQQLMHTTVSFSNDIHMEFGIDKCKMLHVTRGKHELVGFDLPSGDTIDPMEEGEFYKYLGFQQSRDIQHTDIKQNLRKKYTDRLNSLLKNSLNGKNLIKAINTYAVPVLTYSFGVIKWTCTDLEALDRKTRTLLTNYRTHHPQACTERLTLQRCEGGRGLIDIKSLHYKQVKSIREYFFKKQDVSPLHGAVINADNKQTPLDLQNTVLDVTPYIATHTDKKQAWSQKSLHGRHYADLNQINVDKDSSNAWLGRGDLFPETEGFMIAIQDKVINTRNYRKHVIKDRTLDTDTCRLCHITSETIEHITAGCKLLTQTDYLHRHNQVCNVIHEELAIKHNLITTHTPYYKYTPDTVLENTSHKMYYDRSIITDRTIHHNRPDITLIDKHNKTTYLIDIAIPNTNNIHNTFREKITKYTDLAHEVQRMWRMEKVIIVPIIMSSTAVVPKTLHTSIQTLALKENTLHTIQKAVILNTCRTVRKFLTYTNHIQNTLQT